MKVTINVPSKKSMRFCDLRVGDAILGSNKQVLIFKGLTEMCDDIYYDFVVLSNDGIGGIQMYAPARHGVPVELVDIEVIVRPKYS